MLPDTSSIVTSPLAECARRLPVTPRISRLPLADEILSKLYFTARGTCTAKLILASQLQCSGYFDRSEMVSPALVSSTSTLSRSRPVLVAVTRTAAPSYPVIDTLPETLEILICPPAGRLNCL